MPIRLTRPDDLADLQDVVAAAGLFPPEMLPDMLAGWTGDTSACLWLSCLDGPRTVGFCYAVPEALADGTWNMLALAVEPRVQGQGHGSALVAALEDHLRRAGHRLLLADTSGTDAFARTRAFYLRNGYGAEARIRDFWAPGDDKVTFCKALGQR